MKRIFAVGTLLSMSLALSACEPGPAQLAQADDDQPSAPVQASQDHTLRDGLIAGGLGFAAGRITAPHGTVAAAPVTNITHVTHVTHVIARPYRAAPVWGSSYNASRSPSVVTRTTVTRSYRR